MIARMMTVDVEPDWAVGGTRGLLEAVPRLVETFEPVGVRFTFFVVSDLLETAGAAGVRLLRDLAGRHEIASHGKSHARLSTLSPRRLIEELRASRFALEDRLGVAVEGFRGPFFSAHRRVCGALRRAGYRYDSTLGCVAPSPRNVPARRWAPQREGGIVRLPVTTLRDGRTPFCLTYLRLLWPAARCLIDPRARMLYLHPHELLSASSARVLPWPLRWVLARGVGETAWRALTHVVRTVRGRWMTCGGFLREAGLLARRRVQPAFPASSAGSPSGGPEPT